MAFERNLADPDYEPTDEELVGLATRAFSGVAAAHAEELRRQREAIASERARVLARLDARASKREGT